MPLTSLNVVLDLDETLVNTRFDSEDEQRIKELRGYSRSRIYDFRIPDLDGRRGSGEIFDVVGVIRPGLEDFLDFCFGYFQKVTIWSAGTKVYVEHLVSHIFRNVGMPHVIFTRGDCEIMKDKTIRKPITKMIERTKFDMSLENTFLIDDQVINSYLEPNNIIVIPPYEPELSPTGVMRDDGVFKNLKDWLLTNQVMSNTDVKQLDKKNIFSPRTN
jgi:hypothetical protein